MNQRSWCRWCCRDGCSLPSAFSFFFLSFLVLGSVASVYNWVIFTPRVRASVSPFGCQDDNEGSWSIGVFYGDSPLNLKPIETANVWRDEGAAWPAANPVVTCASVTNSGFPSNFVADPFLYILIFPDLFDASLIQAYPKLHLEGKVIVSRGGVDTGKGDILYLFYEIKNSITMQGDIGVARSLDKGATWQHLGIALDEDWHLSYPYVFDYDGQIYMMPEGSAKGDFRLYRAVNFPITWELEKIIMKKPMVDSVIINHNGKFWLLGSDHSGIGAKKKNGQLEIWYSSSSPLGPWRSHKKNPILNTDKTKGARNGGRPFVHNGDLYRVAQDCSQTYGRRILLFKIEVLTTDEYQEVEVPLGFEEPNKGRNAWNGARYHHLDAQQLSSGEWVGVMDGDRVPSGDAARRLILGCVLVLAVAALVMVAGVLIGAVKCIVPMSWCSNSVAKRSDALLPWERPNHPSSKLRGFCSHLNRAASNLRNKINPSTYIGKLVLTVLFATSLVLMCLGIGSFVGGNGAQEPYPVNDKYSQFTMLMMTHDARLWNLKMYVKHYSRCSSVREIVVVWNKGVPPQLSEFDSAVPVRIRVEDENSLNNRFKMDPLIKTRGVLELDDDIMMPCDDIERGFKVWRQHPDRLVGFYPRLVNGKLKYRGEKFARENKGYNMILTGAAFMDSRIAFARYWSENAKLGREMVDRYFNCEDVLLNYLYANASSSSTVEYVRPAWAIDTSKLSRVVISGNTDEHLKIRSSCLKKFEKLYGSLSRRKLPFNRRKDGWDV